MRREPSILHVDLDAFFAAVEQRDKPSLRGKPVIVGGLGPRGVVSTASYEARVFGVRSAMRMAEARARCPHAAFLGGRFPAYRSTSKAVLGVLHALSPLVEPLSLDEAFVDLAAGDDPPTTSDDVRAVAERLKREVTEVTGGLTASVGAGTSKLVAKIASDLDKPDGLVVVEAGAERELLDPMPVGRIPGVGPATRDRLRRIGVQTIGALAGTDETELVATLGQAHGHGLARLSRADDDRPVVSERESKSVSVEDTFDTDIVDPARLSAITDRLADRVCERMHKDGLSGRTITVKIRLYDFTTHTRSSTLTGPTDDLRVVRRVARRLLGEVDTSSGVRLLGVGLSGLADWVQEDLFGWDEPADEPVAEADEAGDDMAGPDGAGNSAGNGSGTDVDSDARAAARRWVPGADVVHTNYGPGWVWGAGLGRVTVRFETAETHGPIRTFRADDPELTAWTPPEEE